MDQGTESTGSGRPAGVSCVDLFCGAGGLTHGLEAAGVHVTAGIDVDEDCRLPFQMNNRAKFICADVAGITPMRLSRLFGRRRPRLLAGCAPCQPYSTYSRGRQAEGEDRWSLLRTFGNLAAEVKPELVTLENVPQLRDHVVFADLLAALDGYEVWHDVVDCPSYGIPQTRKRLVVLASRLGPIKLLPPTHPGKLRPTVRSAIADFPPIAAGETDEADPLHAACSLSEMNMARIRASTPGGTWRDWPKELVAGCHARSTGVTYPSVYGRMEWDRPAPTITTLCYGYGNGRFGHPEQDRAISLREAATLQTFPPDYQFEEAGKRVRFKVVGRLIGNAVPVRLGEVIGQSVLAHLANLPRQQFPAAHRRADQGGQSDGRRAR